MPKSKYANTAKAPYYAAIFSSQISSQESDYFEISEQMEELASKQEGFLGIESARDKDGFGITISYWESEQAIAAWKNNAEHEIARKRGKKEWYQDFEVRVAKVERAYRSSNS